MKCKKKKEKRSPWWSLQIAYIPKYEDIQFAILQQPKAERFYI